MKRDVDYLCTDTELIIFRILGTIRLFSNSGFGHPSTLYFTFVTLALTNGDNRGIAYFGWVAYM